jgi:hypothetical protein
VSEKRSEAERETRKRERLEKEARDLRAQVDAKNDEVRSHTTSSAQAQYRRQPAEGGAPQLQLRQATLLSRSHVADPAQLGMQHLHGWRSGR